MKNEDFEDRLRMLRPELHRYCARMTGSAVDGEDIVQDTIVKALMARPEEAENLEAWLFRIAHNTSLDLLRRKSRSTVALPDDDTASPEVSHDMDAVAVSFRTFLRLPELQRCAVILKDVLGYSTEEISSIADCTLVAAKSALQRGRATLRRLAEAPEESTPSVMSEVSREKVAAYVSLFQSGNFDAIRNMLADDVKLELMNRLQLAGRDKVQVYFTRYASEPKWRFALGAVEGQPAMLVFDSGGDARTPAHFVLLDWAGGEVTKIRDYLFSPYVLDRLEWSTL